MISISTTEIKKLTGLAAMTLSMWIRKGWVRPSRQGSDGRGHSYGFTPQQAVLLVLSAGVQKVFGNAATFVRDNWKLAASFSDDDFRQWMTGEWDQWYEERVAAEEARKVSLPLIPEGKFRDAVYPMLAKLHEIMLVKYGASATSRPIPAKATK
jgi:hypothetical protein